MKATNIFQSLKTAGYCGGKSSNPELPGVSAAKFNAGLKKAATQGKLDDNPKFKAAVEGSSMNKYKKATMAKKLDGKPKEVKAESITYDPASGTTTRVFSDADVEKYGVKKEIVTKAKPKSPNKKYKTSPATKKSCVKFIPEEAGGRKPNTRKNKAQKRVNKMLGGLANANRGCKPHRKIKSR